ncbi:MAG: hypothetical protein JSV81_03040 [Anaerolineales bacterium]|nr:MAG: hypothetical protein JSV81_03040 [Anaerolineales bacterium]
MTKSSHRIIVRKDEAFASQQLPKHWKYHKGEFDKKGRPVFRNMAEAHEASRRARGEEGVNLHYDEL